MMNELVTKFGEQSTLAEAVTATWPAGAYVLVIVIPVSTSRMPLPGPPDATRIGMPADCVLPGPESAVNGMLASVSTIAPAALRTTNVALAVDLGAPAPGVESTIISTIVSSHEYLILSSVTALCGKDEGPFAGAASARKIGPETTRP